LLMLFYFVFIFGPAISGSILCTGGECDDFLNRRGISSPKLQTNAPFGEKNTAKKPVYGSFH